MAILKADTVFGEVRERGRTGSEQVRVVRCANAAREMGLRVDGDHGGSEWLVSGVILKDGAKGATVTVKHTVYSVDELEQFLAGYFAGKANVNG